LHRKAAALQSSADATAAVRRVDLQLHTFFTAEAAYLGAMPTQPKPQSLPDVAGVERAFQMAAHLPTRERVRLRVGVLSLGGEMIFGGTLRGFEQVCLLRDQLQILGFAEHLVPREQENLGCDLLLKQQVRVDESNTADLLRRSRVAWPPVIRPPGRRSG
jgi:hypothetical protein